MRRILPLDESVFDHITEESAYWIGFLMTDGGVVPKPSGQMQIVLQVQARDRVHLEAFKAFMHSGHSIISVARGQERFAFGSQRIAERLASYGVLPRKSLTARVIGLEDNRHFWRGVVDGNGSIGVVNRHYPSLELAGSAPLMEQYRAFVLQQYPKCAATIRPIKSIFRMRLASNGAKALLHVLYEDCTVALPRKHQAALAVMAHAPWIDKARKPPITRS